MKNYTIGVDIGGTKCAVILGKAAILESNLDDFILDRMCFKTEAQKGPDYVISHIYQYIHEIMNSNDIQREEVIGIGISCGGPLDHIHGIVMNPPNLYGWNDIPIVDLLAEKFQLPVYIQNDANACALAEWRFGAAKGYENVIFLTCGTGMGAGLILNGRLYNGSNNMAGEVGHVRLAEHGPVGFGKKGSFEGFCSGGGIAQLARDQVLEKVQMGESPAWCPDLLAAKNLTAKKVALAAEQGDALAKEIYQISGRYLGMGISLLIDILNPQIIVIGSIYERSEELFSHSMQETICKEALRVSREQCRIVPAMLGNQIGDYAALSVALQGGEGL